MANTVGIDIGVGAGAVSTARLPHRIEAGVFGGVEGIDAAQRGGGVGGHGGQHLGETPEKGVNVGFVEHGGVVFGAQG